MPVRSDFCLKSCRGFRSCHKASWLIGVLFIHGGVVNAQTAGPAINSFPQHATTQANAVQANPQNHQQDDSVQNMQQRIEVLEANIQSLKAKQPLEEALEGIAVGGSLTAVAQKVNKASQSAAGSNPSQFNYRGDLEVAVPLGDLVAKNGFLDGASGQLFVHARFGQGAGVGLNPSTFTGAVNSTAFQLQGANDDSTALIAQTYLQMNVPITRQQGRQVDEFQITVGKIDPFGFFDTNPIADDESSRFLNNVFVHNPLLDSGGDIGADNYGFSPGMVAAYRWNVNANDVWHASFGAFGAGNGATFNNSFSDPFVIGQIHYEGRAWLGNAHYQAYAWRNPQASNAFTNTQESHSGIGISLMQQVSKNISVFSRLGRQQKGVVNFDKAATLGMEWVGRNWGRSADHIGLAIGQLKASKAYEAAGNGSGSELNTELYYSWALNDHIQITPSVQRIVKPAANAAEPNITIIGLRTTASF